MNNFLGKMEHWIFFYIKITCFIEELTRSYFGFFQGIKQIFLWIIQILDFSASGQASLVAASTASAGASTLLWTKTQQLPEEAFRQLHSIYSDHFPIEARHHLAGTYFFQVHISLIFDKCSMLKQTIWP